MTSVALPIVVPPAGQVPAPPALQPGAVLQALVLGLIDDLTLRLQLPGGVLDVKTPNPLPAGTRVQVAVEGSAAQPKLMLTPLPSNASGPSHGAMPGGVAIPAAPRMALPAVAGTVPDIANAMGGASHLPQPAANAPPRAVSVGQDSIETAIAALVRHAVGRQNGIAPLLADLEMLLTRPAIDLPAPVRAAAEQVLARRLDVRAPVHAEAIKSAVAASGSAETQNAAPSESAGMRTLLNTLRLVLGNWAQAEADIEIAPKSVSPSAPSAMQAAARMAAPLPPHRGAPTIPQPAATAMIGADLTARETALHLLARTEGALARHTLLQVASLPDAMPADAAKSDQPPARVTLDIPLITAQGNAAAQIRIERDSGGGREGGEVRPVWRASFSIDIEPIGPVHAHVTLHGERATVTLYAERDESAVRLREGLPHLEAGLKDAALDPGEILCRSGAPAAPRHASGLFVDQAS